MGSDLRAGIPARSASGPLAAYRWHSLLGLRRAGLARERPARFLLRPRSPEDWLQSPGRREDRGAAAEPGLDRRAGSVGRWRRNRQTRPHPRAWGRAEPICVAVHDAFPVCPFSSIRTKIRGDRSRRFTDCAGRPDGAHPARTQGTACCPRRQTLRCRSLARQHWHAGSRLGSRTRPRSLPPHDQEYRRH